MIVHLLSLIDHQNKSWEHDIFIVATTTMRQRVRCQGVKMDFPPTTTIATKQQATMFWP